MNTLEHINAELATFTSLVGKITHKCDTCGTELPGEPEDYKYDNCTYVCVECWENDMYEDMCEANLQAHIDEANLQLAGFTSLVHKGGK